MVNGRPDATWSIGCRFHALLRRDVGWGASALEHTSRPENDRPVRDLPPIQSTVKCAGSAHRPKVGQVTVAIGSPNGVDMSSGA